MDRKIVFARHNDGYSPEQVDRYIGMLIEEYTDLYGEYTRLIENCNRLADANQTHRNENTRMSGELDRLWEQNIRLSQVVTEMRRHLKQGGL